MEWQQDYLSLVTQSPGARVSTAPSFAELEESVNSSGEGLLALTLAESGEQFVAQVETSDGYRVDPWVGMVQAINHATEHRKQIAHLMRLLGIDPPRLDGWAFGEATNAVVPLPK